SPEDWAALFAVNARAPFFLMQAAIADMRKRGQGGAIVNILSINAHCGSPELAVYSATKGALATLTKNAANAHRFDRIRVNGINVGWTDTPAERVMQAQTLGHGPGWHSAAN
ncbi:SDR family NAD(P)-dependent oxidoreductase, partial [Mesorhizobium sp. M2D.F.Ca.ET.145.01.1.1]